MFYYIYGIKPSESNLSILAGSGMIVMEKEMTETEKNVCTAVKNQVL